MITTEEGFEIDEFKGTKEAFMDLIRISMLPIKPKDKIKVKMKVERLR